MANELYDEIDRIIAEYPSTIWRHIYNDIRDVRFYGTNVNGVKIQLFSDGDVYVNAVKAYHDHNKAQYNRVFEKEKESVREKDKAILQHSLKKMRERKL